MPRPRALDLFCGAGGMAKGLQDAGFYVVGVDIADQPRYCGDEFVQADALAVLRGFTDHLDTDDRVRWEDRFDVIHASPPCQAYSTATKHRDRHPDLVATTRGLLSETGRPWVMENVPNAPMLWGVTLCGGMFGLEIRRHRTFELSFMVLQPHHRCPLKPWEVTGHAGGHNRLSQSHRKYRDTEHAKQLMDMPWCKTSREVTEAVPPAYGEWIGRRLMEQIERVNA